jgi:hypothetical protein
MDQSPAAAAAMAILFIMRAFALSRAFLSFSFVALMSSCAHAGNKKHLGDEKENQSFVLWASMMSGGSQ